MNMRNYTNILIVLSEYQFEYPSSKGSELILHPPLPNGQAGFWVGVNREKQFADKEIL